MSPTMHLSDIKKLINKQDRYYQIPFKLVSTTVYEITKAGKDKDIYRTSVRFQE